MHHKSKLLLLALIFLLLPITSHAIQYAMVRTTQTIIYSDQKLTSPIGYVKSGTKLKVGSVARQYGTILPVVVSGKIAYIQVKDIELFQTEKELEHASLILKPEEKQAKEIFLLFTYGLSGTGADWKGLSQDFNDAPKNMNIYSLTFQMFPLASDMFITFGFSYSTITQQRLKMGATTVDFTGGYALIRSDFFSLDMFAGPSVIPLMNITVENKINYRGSGYGALAGVQARLFSGLKFGLTAGAYYRYLKLVGYSNDTVYHSSVDDPIQYVKLDSLNGVNFFVGATYKFF